MYRRRGDELIGEICGGASTLDVASMRLKFKKACNDVYNIAKQVCLSGSVGKRADILPGLPGPDMAMYILGGAAL